MASKPSGSRPGKKPPKGSGTPPASKSSSSSSSSAGSGAYSSGSSTSGKSSSSSSSGGQQTGVDVSSIANAVGLGFLILVLGGLLQPAATTFIPQAISQFWVLIVGVVAFVVAGVRAGMTAPKPWAYGAGAAFGSYLLTVPLQFLQASFDPLNSLSQVVASLVIGALGALAGARFSRSRED